MEERRRSARRRKLLTGKIVLRDTSEWGCVVRDLSDGGARVRCDEQALLPESFCLAIQRLGDRRDVRAVWRRDGEVGLAYLS